MIPPTINSVVDVGVKVIPPADCIMIDPDPSVEDILDEEEFPIFLSVFDGCPEADDTSDKLGPLASSKVADGLKIGNSSLEMKLPEDCNKVGLSLALGDTSGKVGPLVDLDAVVDVKEKDESSRVKPFILSKVSDAGLVANGDLVER